MSAPERSGEYLAAALGKSEPPWPSRSIVTTVYRFSAS
jgi:hypothetical protein